MIGQKASRRYRADDFRHIAVGDTQSTNSDCLEKARAGDPGLLWITASRQLGGRGRRGRAWISEAGNLYASLLLINAAPVDRIGTLPLAVALAVRRTIASVLPPGAPAVEVKWPNDVMIGRKKTSGILLEGERLGNGDYALVIGCGINVAHKPENPLYPTTCLAEEGANPGLEELFARLVLNMTDILNIWDESRGVAAIMAEWRTHAMGLGEAIVVNFPDRSISGTFAGIDDDGILQLVTPSGSVIPVAAGDVFFT